MRNNLEFSRKIYHIEMLYYTRAIPKKIPK
jgi:hypothetical protein